MSLEHAFFVSQIVASVAIVASLIFVGLQVRDTTTALRRDEHNSTMAQWTVIRMAIARNRDIAELMTDGLSGERTLDRADQLRLEQLLQENAWRAFIFGIERSAESFRKGHSSSPAVPIFADCSGHRVAVPGGAARSTRASFPDSSRMSMPCSPRTRRAQQPFPPAERRHPGR